MTASLLDTFIAQATHAGPDQSEAITALGLWLEASRVRRPAGNDGGLVSILGPKLGSVRLSSPEVERVVTALSTTILNERQTIPGLLWALAKCAQPRIIPALSYALDGALQKPGMEMIASQALQGLMLFDTPESLSAARRAAEYGDEDLQEQARDYLARVERNRTP